MLKDKLYESLPESNEAPVYYTRLLLALKEQGIVATLVQVYPLLIELRSERKIKRSTNSFGKALWRKR